MAASKSGLAIMLSKLEVFQDPQADLEQYPTDSENAAEIVWLASLKGDIKGKTIADLGCGTGILGIAALLLGAKKVYFVDIDRQALDIAENNLKDAGESVDIDFSKQAEFLNCDAAEFGEMVDTVLENPPFGVQKKHADRSFLEKAFTSAKVIYSLHKIESESFIRRIAEKNSFILSEVLEFNFPLKATQKFHKRKIYRLKVGCFRLLKNQT